MRPVLVNVGCGETWHPDWVNFDASPCHPSIRPLDARGRLPFESGSVDVCYSSHVLEHLGRVEAEHFVGECARVLKPGGILRLVVPDLEMIAREYLAVLDDVRAGGRTRSADYDWILLELLDQVGRDRSGGEMARYLARTDLENRTYIRSRIGEEASGSKDAAAGATAFQRLRRRPVLQIVRAARVSLATFAARVIAGRAVARSVRVGVFRDSGEVHKWMYDRYSLSKLLGGAGFTEVQKRQASESDILRFNEYGLDEVRGKPRKPDSLYMEAIRARS